jgi:hypothetical protein
MTRLQEHVGLCARSERQASPRRDYPRMRQPVHKALREVQLVRRTRIALTEIY